MAKAEPLKPAGEREAALLAAVDIAYPNRMDFFRKVAEVTGREASTEKSHFNRIVHGHQGNQTAWRIGIYADLLRKIPADFLRPSEQREGVVAGKQRTRLSLRGLADDLEDLTLRVDKLTVLTTRLVGQEQQGNQTQEDEV